MEEANMAAEAAGDKWVVEHTEPVYAVYNADVITGKAYGKSLGTMLDVCGIAYVQITDKRTGFAKYIKKIQNGYNNAVHLNSKYSGRQEWGLREACSYAALNVLDSHGIKGVSVWSHID